MARNRTKIEVAANLPPGVSREDFVIYVLGAISTHCKSFEPPNHDNAWTGDPMFEFDLQDNKVTVTDVHARKRYSDAGKTYSVTLLKPLRKGRSP